MKFDPCKAYSEVHVHNFLNKNLIKSDVPKLPFVSRRNNDPLGVK